jgi:hypothetical protein
MQRRFGILRVGIVAAAAWGAAAGTARAAERPCAPKEPSPQEVVACVPGWERFVARREKAREDYPLRFEVGAVHWVNVNRETRKATYGYPGTEGTFYWWVKGDVEAPVRPGGEQVFGAHVEMRWRERTRYAPYYDSRLWLQEAYLYADALGGRMKAGKITGVFGLDCDGTWWCGIPYFDGFQFDPDWGVSYERDFVQSTCFGLKGTAQVFFIEDRVNGSGMGADAESDPDRKEKLSAILRVAPTWEFSGSSLQAGLSGTFGTIEGTGVPDDTVMGVALDATFTSGRWKARAGAYLLGGVRNGANYVTGGPSERLEDVVVCLERAIGPVTLRACWSGGRLHDPDGEQSMWIVGGNVTLIRNVDLFLEYVRWKAQAEGADEVTLEDGFQIILQWHF